MMAHTRFVCRVLQSISLATPGGSYSRGHFALAEKRVSWHQLNSRRMSGATAKTHRRGRRLERGPVKNLRKA